MRVLFVSNPGLGHVNPMFPLADALRRAGHEVAFATAPALHPVIEARGFRAYAAGLDWTEAQADLAFSGFAGLDLDQRGAFLLGEVFADEAAHPMVRDLLAIAGEWRPALLVRNDYEFGSCVAAERLGVPQVTISVCFFMSPTLVDAVIGGQLAYLRSAHGLAPYPATAMLYPHLYLTYAPESLEPQALSCISRLQPDEPDALAAAEAPLGWFADPTRPLVYVSIGTVFNRNPRVFAAVLEGLQDEAVNVLVTVGRNQDPSVLGSQPAHVRVERYVPQERVLPHASLFVTHAPFFTAMSALRCGVPLLMVPQGGDQIAHAMRLARHGVGEIMHLDEHKDPALRRGARELSPAAVRAAARALLWQPLHRERARQIRRQMLDLPAPAEAVGALETLVGGVSAHG